MIPLVSNVWIVNCIVIVFSNLFLAFHIELCNRSLVFRFIFLLSPPTPLNYSYLYLSLDEWKEVVWIFKDTRILVCCLLNFGFVPWVSCFSCVAVVSKLLAVWLVRYKEPKWERLLNLLVAVTFSFFNTTGYWTNLLPTLTSWTIQSNSQNLTSTIIIQHSLDS